MKLPHQPDEIHHILEDVKAEYCFWRCDGLIIHNIYELRDTLSTAKDEVFSRHVGIGKNDFANWANDILKDAELAVAMKKTGSKKELCGILTKRIAQLEHHLDADMHRKMHEQDALEKRHAMSAGHSHAGGQSNLDHENGQRIRQNIYHESHFSRILIEVSAIFIIGLVVGILLGVYIIPKYF